MPVGPGTSLSCDRFTPASVSACFSSGAFASVPICRWHPHAREGITCEVRGHERSQEVPVQSASTGAVSAVSGSSIALLPLPPLCTWPTK